MKPIQRMVQARRELGLTLRDVVSKSAQIAAHHRNRRFRVSLRKLSEMENRSSSPTIHQTCTLALLYNVPISEVLSWYLGSVVEQASKGTLHDARPSRRLDQDSALA